MSRVDGGARSGVSRGELPLPVGSLLVDPVSERHVSRMWRNITAKRAASRGEAGVPLRWAFAGVLLGTLVTLAVVTLPRGGFVAVDAPPPPGPLRLADGSAFDVVDVSPSAPAASARLSDGSAIRVEPSARIEPLASSGTQLVMRLVRGKATFSVVPGGPRRWLIEAGLATIEVVGTEFSVARSAELVRVEVVHGVVLVRGDTLPDGVVRLRSAESVDVRPLRAEAPRDPEPEPRAEPRPPRAAAGTPRWRTALAGGSYRDAYATLGSAGLAGEAARSESADDLFDLADVARLSGHPADAVLPLTRLLSLHSGGPRAPIAALTLGRIELELRRPSDAAAHLEQALRLGVPKGLEEDALVRLVQAYSEAGRRAESTRAGGEYARRYPQGRRSAEVQAWLRR